jgi:hypothetical protein
MKRLILALAFFLITVSIAQSQSLNSVASGKNLKNLSADEYVSINLKLNYYIYIPFGSKIDQGYGFQSEVQVMTTKYFGWLFTSNVLALVKKDHDGIYYTKFGGLILTAAPKFYFNKADLQGYASIGFGVGFSKEWSGLFLPIMIAPAFGIDYKVSKGIRINLETKSNFNFAFIVTPILSQFINAGINFEL